jgi:hypothetical protein
MTNFGIERKKVISQWVSVRSVMKKSVLEAQKMVSASEKSGLVPQLVVKRSKNIDWENGFRGQTH